MPSQQASNERARRRRTLDDVIRFTSSVAEGTEFRGTFSGGENIVIRGCVRGESDVQGVVAIEASGQWIGTLIADVVVVGGYVEGDIQAREKIELMDGARVAGNMRSPCIAIERGAIHEGTIQMPEQTRLTRFAERRAEPLPITE